MPAHALPFGTAAATTGCFDTQGWSNPWGDTCSAVVADGHCQDGAFVPGHEWAAGTAYGSPELNCCACGKDAPKDETGCSDSPAWRNQFAADCAMYESEGNCVDGGFSPGHEWSGGVEFGEPELNCCACGKGQPRKAPLPKEAPTVEATQAPAAAAAATPLPQTPVEAALLEARTVAKPKCTWTYLPKTALHWEIGQFSSLRMTDPVQGGWVCAKLCSEVVGCDAYSWRRSGDRLPNYHRCFLLKSMAGGAGTTADEFDSAYKVCAMPPPPLPPPSPLPPSPPPPPPPLPPPPPNPLPPRPPPPPPPSPPPPPPPRPQCIDTPGWANQYGLDCAGYVSEGHCANGEFQPGHEWTTGQAFSNPETNCCACGAPPTCVGLDRSLAKRTQSFMEVLLQKAGIAPC